MHTVSPVVLPTFDSPQDSKQRLDILVPNTMGNTSFGSNTDDTVSISVAKAIQMIKVSQQKTIQPPIHLSWCLSFF